LKAQKLEEDSRLPPESAIESLRSAGATQKAGPRLEDRLATVQAILGDDLLWIERTLAACTEVGPAPATDAAKHLVVRGGKRVRPTALLLSAACFGSIPSAARELAVVSEMVHSATLLHDDVVDNGDERRGAPCARLLWGNGISVLAGDLLLVGALERTSVHAPDIMPDLIVTLRRLVEGEIIQLRGRVALDVSEATYLRILRDKTASLFAWSTRTGARLAGASVEQQESLAFFGDRLGIAFQLVDDVLDYESDQTGKTLFADLKEGKLTLPLVLAVARQPELAALLSRIHQGDQEPVLAVSRAVVESGTCDEVRRRAREHTASAIEALQSVPPSAARALLQGVAEQLVARVG
jgi:octaprenyl-diphosphate synthase